jgi:anti-sigma B factor antagonist
MKVTGQAFDTVVVVSIDGPAEIDIGNAEAFRDGALAAIGNATRVVVDCGYVEFFDSAGLGALLAVQKRIAERGGKLVLASVNRAVADIFRMVGFDVVFLTYPDLPRAIQALGAKG